MQTTATTFTFKENMLTRCFISIFFGIAALVITLAAFIKLRENLWWSIVAVVALAAALALFYFVYTSLRSSQTITVTPQEITSVSKADGLRRIAWKDITSIREVQTRVEKARAAAPFFEVMLALYFNLPFLADITRRGLLIFEAGESERIAIRQHLVYAHRMDELRQGIVRYAPARSQGEQFLKLNRNN